MNIVSTHNPESEKDVYLVRNYLLLTQENVNGLLEYSIIVRWGFTLGTWLFYFVGNPNGSVSIRKTPFKSSEEKKIKEPNRIDQYLGTATMDGLAVEQYFENTAPDLIQYLNNFFTQLIGYPVIMPTDNIMRDDLIAIIKPKSEKRKSCLIQ
jgi:hypothetical protein